MSVPGEVIIWVPLLGVLVCAALLRTSYLEHTKFKRWIQQTHVIPACLRPLFRRCSLLSPLLSLSLSSCLAFTVAGLLPLALRSASLALDFPTWSRGYQTSGVEAYGGRVLGELNFFTLAFVMLPVTHTSIIVMITGVSMERAIVFHRIWARLTIFIMFMHGLWMWCAFGTASHDVPPTTPANMNYVFIQRQYIKPFEHVTHMYIDPDTKWSNLSGLLAFVCFAGMGITSVPYFRRHHFELFHASHLLLALLGFIFAYLHMPAIARYAAPAWSCYGLDLLLRIYHAFRYKGTAQIVALEGGITRISVQFKNSQLPFEAGQYAFIRIPTLSLFQNHPFSISSSPHQDGLTFHVLAMHGKQTWTSQLRGLGNAMDVEGRIGTSTACYVDGAYGIPSIPIFSYPNLVLVVGGIGMTPAASILSYLLHTTLRSSSHSRSSHLHIHTTRVHLIWIVSNHQVFDVFDPLLTLATTCFKVTLHLYNTERGNQHETPMRHEGHDTQQQDQSIVRLHDKSWRNHIKSGRPNLSTFFSDLVGTTDPSSIGVMSCGPEPLIVSTRDVCSHHKISFHRETFLL